MTVKVMISLDLKCMMVTEGISLNNSQEAQKIDNANEAVKGS